MNDTEEEADAVVTVFMHDSEVVKFLESWSNKMVNRTDMKLLLIIRFFSSYQNERTLDF